MPKKARDYALFLKDILSAIDKIERYTRNLSLQNLVENDMAVDAIVRNLEVIGEASKNVPERMKQKYPFVEWKEAIGFRNVLIHEYFGIDIEAVWDTIKNNLPSLKHNIMKVLESEKKDSAE
ncbi:MAG TPA: DUF86 domain-containing protein [Syntrophorhabdaceae bacterium]|jgi:uncharacterized protein with HEPN domain|nr:DUF86 domain-containing protein [Syntrophorhabdaceae bacterium]